MAKDKKEEKETEPAQPVEQRTAFERVQLARHADRPYTLDLIERLFEDFVELHGDKRFAEDPAIVCRTERGEGSLCWERCNSVWCRLWLAERGWHKQTLS